MPTSIIAIRMDQVEDTDENIRLLARWLRDEDELRGRVNLQEAPIQQGQMGGVAEAVIVVVTSGGATVFVRSLFAWLARRKEAEKVSLTVESAAGQKIDLKCGSMEDAQKLLKVLDGK